MGNVDFSFVVMVLSQAAPIIDEHGLDRAVSLGLLDADPETLDVLRSLVPFSRGGSRFGPDVEADWRLLLEATPDTWARVVDDALEVEARSKGGAS